MGDNRTRCNHEFTDIAPEVESDLDNPDTLIWQWCIKCGCLKLGNQIFSPGNHQKQIIVADKFQKGTS